VLMTIRPVNPLRVPRLATVSCRRILAGRLLAQIVCTFVRDDKTRVSGKGGCRHEFTNAGCHPSRCLMEEASLVEEQLPQYSV
jgi:hypothetical protein